MNRREFLFVASAALMIACQAEALENEEIPNEDTSYDDTIPIYWNIYLKDKINTLKREDIILGDNGFSFVFITDSHIRMNRMLSPKIIKYIGKNTNVRKVVFGGDVIVDYTTAEIAYNDLSTWKNAMEGNDFVSILGNHDTNANAQTSHEEIISKSDYYSLLMKQSDDLVHWYKDALYGYEDIEKQKVRFIYLDTGAPDYAVIDGEQLLWMKSVITELEKGWSVLIFCHQFFTGGDINQYPSGAKLPIDNNGIEIQKTLDSIYDIVNAVIIGVICGHCHRDYSIKSYKGYPIIATTTDACGFQSSLYDPDNPIRTEGTITEQCFDLFYVNQSTRTIKTIRIGAGDEKQDRIFNY